MYPNYLVEQMHQFMVATNPQEIDELYAKLEEEVSIYHAESGMDREADFNGEWVEDLLNQAIKKYGPLNLATLTRDSPISK